MEEYFSAITSFEDFFFLGVSYIVEIGSAFFGVGLRSIVSRTSSLTAFLLLYCLTGRAGAFLGECTTSMALFFRSFELTLYLTKYSSLDILIIMKESGYTFQRWYLLTG